MQVKKLKNGNNNCNLKDSREKKIKKLMILKNSFVKNNKSIILLIKILICDFRIYLRNIKLCKRKNIRLDCEFF